MADPRSISTGQGRGRAQVFDRIDFGDDIAESGIRAGERDIANQKAKKAAEEKRLKDMADFSAKMQADIYFPADNDQLIKDTNMVLLDAFDDFIKGNNPNNNPLIRTRMNEIEIMYASQKNAYSEWEKGVSRAEAILASPNDYDEETVSKALDSLDQYQQYAKTPIKDRMNMSLPKSFKVQKKEEFDPFKLINQTTVGVVTRRTLDPETRSGTETTEYTKKSIREQAEAIAQSYSDKEIQEGIKRGLWKNRQEAIDFTETGLINKTSTRIIDIVAPKEGKDKSTGFTRDEETNNFQQWKKDLIAGEDEAQAFLLDLKLPDGTIIEEVKVASEEGLSVLKPFPEGGFLPSTNPKLSLKSYALVKGADGSAKDYFDENIELVENDELLFKLYKTRLKDTKTLYRGGEINQTVIGEEEDDFEQFKRP